MASETTILRWSNVPGFLPSDFVDRVLLNVRPVKQGIYTPWKVLTENPEPVVFDSLNIQRLIQCANYDRYTLEFVGNEDYNIGMLEFANTILVVVSATNKTHHAKIIGITSTRAGNTPSKKYMIEFFDLNIDNYPNGLPIISPMRSDIITSWQALTSLSRVRLTGSWGITSYYTPFTVKDLPAEIENQKDTEVKGVKIVTRLTIKVKRELIFYMTDATAAEFSLRSPQIAILLIEQGGVPITIGDFEPPTVTVEPVAGGIDLNKVTFNFSETITDLNPLS